MKKLLLTALAFGLFSCSNSDETTENSNQFGQLTFIYNGETTSINGQNDVNNPQTNDIYKSTFQAYNISTQKVINLNGGLSNGNHVVILSLADNGIGAKSVAYGKNGVIKVNTNSIQGNTNITITEETTDYISGTFYAPDLTGTFTKIPKKK